MKTRKLTDFCTEFSYKDLSEDLIQAVKHLFLDFLGVSLGGFTLPSSKIVISTVKDFVGIPESTIIGVGEKVLSQNAALANGVMAHGLELDDVHNESSLHPGAPVISAALATAEKEKVDGKTFALGVVLGYEVMARIGVSVTPSAHYAHGFHPTGTCGAFGATVAVGKILNLQANQLTCAMGIAGSQAAGLLEYLANGSWTKRFHAGWAAHNGIIAALLAKNGYTGPSTVLEGKHGFVRTHSDKQDFSRLTEGLGESFAILNVSVKPHACCRYMHAPIDAVLELVRENNIKPENVDEVTISLVKSAIPIVGEPLEAKYNPQSVVDAQMNMPFGVAVAILKHRAFVDEFTEKMIKNSEVLSLARRTRIIHDPELDKVYPKLWPAKTKIKTKDGKTYEARVDISKGDPGNPLTEEELQEKFRILAGKVLTKEKIDEIVRMVQRLETLEEINILTELLH